MVASQNIEGAGNRYTILHNAGSSWSQVDKGTLPLEGEVAGREYKLWHSRRQSQKVMSLYWGQAVFVEEIHDFDLPVKIDGLKVREAI